ncbi:MAG: RHS repeat-associated core domain-containing protein [Microthrixaceae bacterium]
MGARQYHPILARFLQTDPTEGGVLNDYAYVTDPTDSQDLTGKCSVSNFVKQPWEKFRNPMAPSSCEMQDRVQPVQRMSTAILNGPASVRVTASGCVFYACVYASGRGGYWSAGAGTGLAFGGGLSAAWDPGPRRRGWSQHNEVFGSVGWGGFSCGWRGQSTAGGRCSPTVGYGSKWGGGFVHWWGYDGGRK